VEVEQDRTSEGTVNRMVIHGRGSITTPAVVRYEYLHVDRADVAPPRLLDGYVMGALQWAMALGEPLVVRGPVSMAALRNAMSFMDVWACWAPDRYRRVDLLPDTVVESDPAPASAGRQSAVAAFSGGVDSTFTLLRHASGSGLPWSHEVRDVVMVHGFDVPRANRAAFDGLLHRTRPLLDSLGVGLRQVRTNVREWPELDWEQTYGAQLACVLHQFDEDFDRGLIAAGPHYLQPFVPWGSSALTDPMLSGVRMSIVHDGAAFTRIPKVREIARNPVAMATVKVCWEGEHPDRNCGRCEKCLRTRLSFAAVGVPDPPCFDEPLDLESIRSIHVHNEHGVRDLRRIVEYCDENGVGGEWLDVLRRRTVELAAAYVAGSGAERRRVAVQRGRRNLRRLRMRARQWRAERNGKSAFGSPSP
jgi:hypothetical protein